MTTTAHSRFQVLSRFGSVAHCQTFIEAKHYAEYYDTDAWPMAIYDLMAHKGKPQTWNLLPNYTWKVVEIRTN